MSRALQLGVRVVELDCYDTNTKAKVCVTHGGTLCTAAPFASFIQAVKQNAFVAATLAPWPRKHGAPSLQVTFDLVYADARGPSGGLA